jgi:hypothetical protein
MKIEYPLPDFLTTSKEFENDCASMNETNESLSSFACYNQTVIVICLLSDHTK